MYLMQKKVLPSLFLSFMLILCPTQYSKSDVHLTVGDLVPKPLNRSEAEGDLVILNLLPVMPGVDYSVCGIFPPLSVIIKSLC